jgi:parallel beta-helix repeat protein
MKRTLLLLLVCAAAHPGITFAAGTAPRVLAGERAAPSRNFYVSPSGSDAGTGTSPSAAWRTLARVDSAPLLPGDRVHLQGGATFREPLAPYAGTAGTGAAPIVFDSYGSRRVTLAAGIYLNSVSNLDFEDLNVTSTGKGIFSSAGGSGTRAITLRDLTISDVPLAGISSNNPADSGWLIDGVTISQTGDSGIYFKGSNFTITDSTIVTTGTRPSIGYPRHGIYAAGPTPTIANNTITQSSTSGISLRYQNGLVEGNRISGGVRGVSFEEQATIAGTTKIFYNAISNVSDSGIVVARTAIENFVVANNTIQGAGAYGMYFQVVPNLTIANNIVQATTAGAGLLSVRAPSASYSEHNNLWYGGSSMPFYWNGSGRTFGTYRNASRQGLADLTRDPMLAPNLALAADSPALEAGSAAVDTSLEYRALCDGQPFSYCGLAPDLGAYERRQR